MDITRLDNLLGRYVIYDAGGTAVLHQKGNNSWHDLRGQVGKLLDRSGAAAHAYLCERAVRQLTEVAVHLPGSGKVVNDKDENFRPGRYFCPSGEGPKRLIGYDGQSAELHLEDIRQVCKVVSCPKRGGTIHSVIGWIGDDYPCFPLGDGRRVAVPGSKGGQPRSYVALVQRSDLTPAVMVFGVRWDGQRYVAITAPGEQPHYYVALGTDTTPVRAFLLEP